MWRLACQSLLRVRQHLRRQQAPALILQQAAAAKASHCTPCTPLLRWHTLSAPLARTRPHGAMSSARGSCVMTLLRNAAGEEVYAYVSDAPLRDCGAWWERAEAVALRAALADALAAAPPAAVIGYSIDDVLRARSTPAITVALRCAAASDERDAQSRQQWIVAEPAYLDDTEAAVLTHTFEVPAGDGQVPLRMTLRTLLAPNGNYPEGPWAVQLQGLTLSAPVALPAVTKDDALACAVELNGAALTEQDVCRLQTSHRAALKACRAAQLLHAVAACIDARWLGGVRVLRRAVEPLLPRGVVATYAALLTALDALPARPGHLPRLNNASFNQSRIREAEALEAQGRHAAAADIYRELIPSAERDPTFHNVPLLHAYLGIALRMAGDVRGARSAYERGLESLTTPGLHCLQNDTPETRESMRLYLLRRLLVTAVGDRRVQRAYCKRMFEPVITALQRLGFGEGGEGEQVAFDMDGAANDMYIMEMLSTGRRWGVVYTDDHALAACIGYKLEELPRAGQRSRNQERAHQRKLVTDNEDERRALAHAAVVLPKPARACAACGATADKMQVCSLCGQVSYCGKTVRRSALCGRARARVSDARPVRSARWRTGARSTSASAARWQRAAERRAADAAV
jgi:hypothetical protein